MGLCAYGDCQEADERTPTDMGSSGEMTSDSLCSDWGQPAAVQAGVDTRKRPRTASFR